MATAADETAAAKIEQAAPAWHPPASRQQSNENENVIGEKRENRIIGENKRERKASVIENIIEENNENGENGGYEKETAAKQYGKPAKGVAKTAKQLKKAANQPAASAVMAWRRGENGRKCKKESNGENESNRSGERRKWRKSAEKRLLKAI
jgi:hypothetical protein